MKNYIIYSIDGHTECNDGEHVENCQILAFVKANDMLETVNKFKKMPYGLAFYEEHDMDRYNMIVVEVVGDKMYLGKLIKD